MRKRLLTSLAAAVMLALTLAAPAFATHDPAHTLGPPAPFGHPFCGSGEEYAHEHIRTLAQAQNLGPAHGVMPHTPGWHQGFAVCDPAGIF
jgi:hypothetical protein